MNEPPDEIKLRLLFILHRGFVEARLLAGAGKTKQVFDLSDTLELIPGMLQNWQDGDWQTVRTLLKTYQEKYPIGRFDYMAHLSDQDVPPF